MIDLKKYEFLQLSFSMEDGGLVRQQNREEENIHGTSDNKQIKNEIKGIEQTDINVNIIFSSRNISHNCIIYNIKFRQFLTCTY